MTTLMNVSRLVTGGLFLASVLLGMIWIVIRSERKANFRVNDHSLLENVCGKVFWVVAGLTLLSALVLCGGGFVVAIRNVHPVQLLKSLCGWTIVGLLISLLVGLLAVCGPMKQNKKWGVFRQNPGGSAGAHIRDFSEKENELRNQSSFEYAAEEHKWKVTRSGGTRRYFRRAFLTTLLILAAIGFVVVSIEGCKSVLD